jgi:hypothetical protein
MILMPYKVLYIIFNDKQGWTLLRMNEGLAMDEHRHNRALNMLAA